MNEPEGSNEADGAVADDDELAACRKQVTDLTAELTTTLWQMNQLITMVCALSHLASPTCDCDERIATITARLDVLHKAGRGALLNA